MKRIKLVALLWNFGVDCVVLLLPLIVQHKDTIIKHAKKIKV